MHASFVCTVLSADMKWVPLGDQASRLEDARPVLDDISLPSSTRSGEDPYVYSIHVAGS